MTHVFARLLGKDYGELPGAVRAFHDAEVAHYRGHASSGGARNPMARLVRLFFGFPTTSENLDVDIWLRRDPSGDHWDRRFGTRRFSSRFRPSRDGTLLDERFGPFRFAFRLRRNGDRMYWDFSAWRLWLLPLPKALGPRIETFETESPCGEFEFYSHADFPILGRLVHYHGFVRPHQP